MMIYDQPDLVQAVFDRVREIIVAFYKKLVRLDRVAGFFQGDDMGFRSGTLVSPDFLRTHVFTGHKQLTDLAHQHGKIDILHSCGNLDAIMEDLISDVKIDVKHSFEDVIEPIEQAYDKYADRIGLLGGLDLDLLSRAPEQDVRRRCRQILDHCQPNGRFAFGSGNSLTDYIKPENLLAMYDEAYNWGK